MNLSKIESLVRNRDLSKASLQYLISCKSECEYLDYKEQFTLDNDYAICSFAKDALAIKNIGGGFVVIGVVDKTWEPVGIENPLSYDSKELKDKIRKASGIDLQVDIVPHTLSIDNSRKHFALIYIRSTRKRSKLRIPTMVKTSFCPKENYGLRQGEIYVRDGDETVRVNTPEMLEEILERLRSEADEAAFNHNESPSSFAINNGLYKLLDKGYESFIGRKDLGEDLEEAITKDPRIWIINVHGPGGVGKSSLVNWIIYKFYEEKTFESIIHLSAKDTQLTETGIREIPRSLNTFENLLDHILSTFEEDTKISLDEKKEIVLEYLEAFTVLLVLDNMETVDDARILKFVQNLPPSSKAKVLLTSRHKTGRWENPISVEELKKSEVKEYIEVKSREEGIDFPLDDEICEKVREVTGGLPLAIQWLIGQYKIKREIKSVLSMVKDADSPVLEFSFGNIWKLLGENEQKILATLSIFDIPPTQQQIAIATEYSADKITDGLYKLSEVTLVRKITQSSDGNTVYSALPITLTFARNKLSEMGNYELDCRRRFETFNAKLELQDKELHEFRGVINRFGLETDNEKRAAIICKQAIYEASNGNLENANNFYIEARELAPQSAYVHAMSAQFELSNSNIGQALKHAKVATARCDKKTGSLCYSILARIQEKQKNWNDAFFAYKKAIEFEPNNTINRHQYAIALSRRGKTSESIEEFAKIIELENMLKPPRRTLLMSLVPRIKNLRKVGRKEEAQQDIEFAKQILRDNPHLQDESWRLEELDEI